MKKEDCKVDGKFKAYGREFTIMSIIDHGVFTVRTPLNPPAKGEPPKGEKGFSLGRIWSNMPFPPDCQALAEYNGLMGDGSSVIQEK